MSDWWTKNMTRAGARRNWRDGEIDADPYLMPAYTAGPAQDLPRRAAGFIRYAAIYRDMVTVNDSSPLFGVWSWRESIRAYKGVSIRVAYRRGDTKEPVIIVELIHPDAAKNVLLHVSFDGADASARWRSWSKELGLPALVEDRSGETRLADPKLGGVFLGEPQPHKGASALSARRPLSFGYTGRGRYWPDRLVTGARPHAY